MYVYVHLRMYNTCTCMYMYGVLYIWIDEPNYIVDLHTIIIVIIVLTSM